MSDGYNNGIMVGVVYVNKTFVFMNFFYLIHPIPRKPILLFEKIHFV